MLGAMRVFSLGLALAAPLGLAAAELWRQDFESRLPGELPEGWRHAWGAMPACDTIAVSNMERLSGRRSLLVERRDAGPGTAQHGFSCHTAALPKQGELRLRLPFLAYGSGDEVGLGVEIRAADGQSRLVSVHLGNGEVAAGGVLGPLRFGQWQRVTLTLPVEASGKKGTAVLETLLPDGSWSRGAGVEFVPGKTVEGGKGLCVMLCAGPGKGSYRIYLDDLTLDPLTY